MDKVTQWLLDKLGRHITITNEMETWLASGFNNLAKGYKLFKFMERKEFDKNSAEYTETVFKLLIEDDEYKVDRFIELNNEIEEDPDFLLRECFSGSLYIFAFWSDIANFDPGSAVIAKINGLSGAWAIQDIESATGTRINLDYFGVNIQQMPKK